MRPRLHVVSVSMTVWCMVLHDIDSPVIAQARRVLGLYTGRATAASHRPPVSSAFCSCLQLPCEVCERQTAQHCPAALGLAVSRPLISVRVL